MRRFNAAMVAVMVCLLVSPGSSQEKKSGKDNPLKLSSIELIGKELQAREELAKARENLKTALGGVKTIRKKAAKCSYKDLADSVVKDAEKQMEKVFSAQEGAIKSEKHYATLMIDMHPLLLDALKKDLALPDLAKRQDEKVALQKIYDGLKSLKTPKKSDADTIFLQKSVLVTTQHIHLSMQQTIRGFSIFLARELGQEVGAKDTEKQAEVRKSYLEFLDQVADLIERLPEKMVETPR